MQLNFEPAIYRSDLLASPIKKVLENWHGTTSVNDILVAEIDPNFMGGIDLCKKYNIPQNMGANCVIIEAFRGIEKTFAACLIPVNSKRTDFNGVVRRYLNARRISLAPLEEVLKATNMEYGSITVFGLPESWPILIDPSIVLLERVIIGAGLQKSKLSLPGKTYIVTPSAIQGEIKKRD